MKNTPDELLKIITNRELGSSEGRLKIFLGMVAGVGKTYSMLNAARDLKKSGIDVVIGLVETHGRVDTEAMLEGLEIVPRMIVRYKERDFTEMDTDSIIRRRPHIVLVDELAHTNIPGSRHVKRYQDVEEILAAGITVYSTLNIQHIESLADTVREIANIEIKEKIPDSFIDRASEIVLIDLAPEQIIDRLQAGKIYPTDRIQDSMNNFFTRGNLNALRELSLRLVADRVDGELKDFKVIHGVPQIWKTNHKLMVGLYNSDRAEQLIRWTRRLAANLNATWLGVFVNTGNQLEEDKKELLMKNMNLVKELGGEVVTIQDDDEVNGLIRVARNHQVTQIVFGRPNIKWPSYLFGQTFIQRFLNACQEIDIYIVGSGKKTAASRIEFLPYNFFDFKKIMFSFLGVLVVTTLCYFLRPLIGYRTIGLIYLIFINLGALYLTGISIIFASIFSGVFWSLLFVQPNHPFLIKTVDDWLLIIVFFIASIIVGTLSSKLRQKEEFLRQKEARTSALYYLTRSIFAARNTEEVVKAVIDKIREIFNVPAGVFLKSTNMSSNLNSNLSSNDISVGINYGKISAVNSGTSNSTGTFENETRNSDLVINANAININANAINNASRMNNSNSGTVNPVNIGNVSSSVGASFYGRDMREGSSGGNLGAGGSGAQGRERNIDRERSFRNDLIGNIEVDDKEYNVVKWVFINKRPAGKFTNTLPSAKGYYLPLNSSSGIIGVLGIFPTNKTIMSYEQQTLLENFSKQLALGIEREYLHESIKRVQIGEATEKVYSTLLNSVSQELKTPLTSIENAAAMLIDDKILKQENAVKELSEEIINSSKRMQNLVQNLLDMSQIDAGKIRPKEKLVDLKVIISKSIEQSERYLGKRVVKTNYPAHLPLIYVDPVLFEQAFKNILQNAYTYSPVGSQIDINVSVHDYESDHKFIMTINILDQGVGLPWPEEIVFQKFYRADPSLPGGAGLGLTTAKAIIEMHGGEIHAKNITKEGGAIIGANFELTIPVSVSEGE